MSGDLTRSAVAPKIEDVTASIEDLAGTVIADKYRIRELVGRGGMGAVYAAEHVVLRSELAIKVLRPDVLDDVAVTRFLREATAASKVRSDNVVRVFDYGQHAGRPYLVMELLHGSDYARELKRRGPLPVAEVVDVLLQAIAGIERAHAEGIVHRDLKPSNIFVTTEGDRRQVKVLDFGISKSLESEDSASVTTSMTTLGSPAYMAPEQIRHASAADVRSDVWALGVIAYELVTGTRPFRGDGPGAIFAAILETVPAPIRERRPDVPASLERVIVRCLQRDPSHRFQTAAALANALRACELVDDDSAVHLVLRAEPEPPSASQSTWDTSDTSDTSPPERSFAYRASALLGAVAVAATIAVFLGASSSTPVAARSPRALAPAHATIAFEERAPAPIASAPASTRPAVTVLRVAPPPPHPSATAASPPATSSSARRNPLSHRE